MPERINRTISILYRYGQRFLAARLRPLGVEVGLFPALMRAYSKPGITQERISMETGMDKGTTARSVQRMEELGLVCRETDAVDRRVNHIYPTAKAESIREQVYSIIDELHTVLYSGMSEAETAQSLALVDHMKQNLMEYMIRSKAEESKAP